MIPLTLLFLLLSFFQTNPIAADPVYALAVEDTATLRRQCDVFIAMSDSDMLALVPPQGGFYYSGSPATTQGAQENNLSWDISMGNKVKCIYTGKMLPDDEYPENAYVDVPTPTGKLQRYHYHEAADGKKYWFEARRWMGQRTTMESAAYNMARLFRSNPDVYREYGRRAVLILTRFAQLYPDYVVKHDYPGMEKVFLDKAAHDKAAQKIDHYFIELTNWSYWGYHNISTSLILAYDQLRGMLSEQDAAAAENMFEGMTRFAEPFEQVPVTNMHPVMWTQKAIAGNVLKKPELVKTAIAGVEKIIAEQFMYDGFYNEATVSYHDQTVNGLKSVLSWAFPGLEKDQLADKIRNQYPMLDRAIKGNLAYRFPDGRYAAINDTHWTDRQPDTLNHSVAELMPAAGHVVLGAGSGKGQFQVHLGYAGWHGHNHYGNLGLVLFAHGKEMISDIGYTHTRARTWTMTTAAHNTVVVDGKSQRQKRSSPRAGLGDLLLLNTQNPDFQVVEVKADDVYPESVSDYRRTLVSVKSGETRYVADIFQVSGGSRHDWILHGSADEEQQLELNASNGNKLAMTPLPSLVPAGVDFEELKEQGRYELIWKDYWAYGHFKEVSSGLINGTLKATYRYPDNTGLQTWLPVKKEHTVYQVKSWAIRGANEDQGILDDYLRSGLIVRSEGNKSCFAAIHVPFQGTAGVADVETILTDDKVLVLKIVHASGMDYVIYRHDEKLKNVSIEGGRYDLTGKVTLVQKTAAETRSQNISSQVLPLSRFGKDHLIVRKATGIKPGQTAIVRHGDGHTTAFRIDSVRAMGDEMQIFTREPVPFRAVSDDVLEMKTFPFLSFKGPHSVTIDRLNTPEIRQRK